MKPVKVIACRSEQSFSLGVDSITLGNLKKLQGLPELALEGSKIPSRTLITRQAIRFYSLAVRQAKESGKLEWLNRQNRELKLLAQQGRKSKL